MRTVFITAVSAALWAFVAAPASAQDTVTGAPPGTAPVTVEGYGTLQGQTAQPGIGNDYPAYYYGYGPGYGYYAPGYGYYGPGPIGAVGSAVGAVGAGVADAAGAITSGAAGVVTGRPAYLERRHCHVYRDERGRRICGP